MKGVVDALVGIVLLLTISGSVVQVYQEIRRVALVKVARGLSPLEPFTRKLTGTRSE